MNTETTLKQWPLLTSFLAARGTPNGVELFEDARNSGAETDTDAKLGVVVPDDNMSIANIRAVFLTKVGKRNEDDKYYLVSGQEAEDGSWWQMTFGSHRIEGGEGFTPAALVTWEKNARAELKTMVFADPRDEETAGEILIDVILKLTALLSPPSAWPFALSFITCLGDAKGQANLDYVQRVGAFTPTALGLNIYPPGDGGQAGAVTVQRFFQFSEDTRDSFRVAVHDFGRDWSAEFGGIQVYGSILTVEDLNALSETVFKHLSTVLLDPEQRGEAIMLVGAFIRTAAKHLAAQAK